MTRTRVAVTIAIVAVLVAAGCGGGGGGGGDEDSGTDATVDPGDGDADADTPDMGETDTGGDVPVDPGDVEAEDVSEEDGTGGELEVWIEEVGSRSLRVLWAPVVGAAGWEVRLGPEPPAGGVLDPSTDPVTLGAAETFHDVEGLAASTDVFVVVTETGSGAWGAAHARTVGGPRADLEDALREVHAHGTDVLMLVLSNPRTEYEGGPGLVGDLGEAWQGGTWTVTRADGTGVAVEAVHRHSIPVGQPEYPVGYEMWGDDDIVDVDHRIFLDLAEPLGDADLLEVAHAGDAGTDLEVLVPWSDRYMETLLVQVNQVGYCPRSSMRWAYVSGWMGDGGSADLASLPAEAEVLSVPGDPLVPRPVALASLPIVERAASDGDAGGQVLEIDLAALPASETATYRVRIPGLGVSWPTAVSEASVAEAFRVIWRGIWHNRWCGDLDPALTDWSRAPDHCVAHWVETGLTDPWVMFDPSTPTDDPRPLEGGHHDAGDFDIRVFHVVAGQYMLRAYEMTPSKFTDGQLGIPESGNGIPDVLDEALWSVSAWEQLQNPDGSIRAGVESWAHPRGYYYADDDELDYWTYDPIPWHTAHASGLLAQAAFLVDPFDAARGAELELAARAAYAWAAGAGAADEYLLYGASELCRLTGEASYCDDFETYWWAIDAWGRGAFDNVVTMMDVYPGMWDSYHPAMADFVMGYHGAALADGSIAATIESNLDERASDHADLVLDSIHAHRSGRDGGHPDWGMATVTGRHADMIYQRLQIGGLSPDEEQAYTDVLSLLADWFLGCNPMGHVYVTGLGSRHPEEPVHVDSLAFIQDAGMPPMPGIPVYGMVREMPGSTWYRPPEAAFHPVFEDQPLGFRYCDTRTCINMSEFTVWENQAPLAELFAALLAPGT